MINAILAYFGGKRTMAPDIVKQLGKHTQYFEPFCGSMAVLFAKPPSQKETVNDLHADLVNLARVLRRRSTAEQLYDRVQRALFGDDILSMARAELEKPFILGGEEDAIERAYWYFIGSWQCRNGIAGMARVDYQLSVRWTKGGGSPTVRWRHACDSIPEWHERLRNVVILNRDAFKIIPKFEDDYATAIYCDPPYAMSTRGTGKTQKKDGASARYMYEFEHGDGLFGNEHVQLRDQLLAFKKARIVVSYYDCPEIRELYLGWTFIEKTRQKNLSSQNKRGETKKDAPEILIVNGEEYK